jgi:hypothetical protein
MHFLTDDLTSFHGRGKDSLPPNWPTCQCHVALTCVFLFIYLMRSMYWAKQGLILADTIHQNSTDRTFARAFYDRMSLSSYEFVLGLILLWVWTRAGTWAVPCRPGTLVPRSWDLGRAVPARHSRASCRPVLRLLGTRGTLCRVGMA